MKRAEQSLALCFCGATLLGMCGVCESAENANYAESNVPEYTLPDPLVCISGERVVDSESWLNRRRGEVLRQFEEHVYGRILDELPGKTYEVIAQDDRALGGKATRKTIRCQFGTSDRDLNMDIVLYVPNDAKSPVPLFLGMLLFDSKSDQPMPGKPLLAELGEVPEGLSEERFPGEKTIEVILDRGYAIATIDPDGLAPDDAKMYLEGVLPLFWQQGQSAREPTDCGALGAWAWGLSRALDYFQSGREENIDGEKVIAIGHSRRGKAALWAGAQDPRFVMVISNQSGCGGAALSRRVYGETVRLINDRFPHWFCEAFRQYNGNEALLPVDQHELIALIAPRPVYVGSAEEDRWADPKGEFLACVGAESVYGLFGKNGLGSVEMPKTNVTVGETIGYHIRSGKHALSDLDWMMYLDFADRKLK